MDEKYSSVKNALSYLCGIAAHLLRLAEVSAAQIKVRVPEVLCGHMAAGSCLQYIQDDCVQRIRIKPCDWQVGFHHCPAIIQITLSFHALCMIFSFNCLICSVLSKIVL